MEQKNFPPHALGHEANSLAQRAEDKKRSLDELKEIIQDFLKHHQEQANLSNIFVLISGVMFFTWLLTGFVEFLVSQPMYYEMVGQRFQGIPPLALILFAILPSALIAEPFFPLFTRASNLTYSHHTLADTIINRRKKNVSLSWIMFVFGIIISVILISAMLNFSRIRVQLMQEAGIQVESTFIQLYLPAFLLAIEIIAGIFVLSFVYYSFYFYPRLKYLRWKIKSENFLYEDFAARACEMWDAYLRELEIYNRKNNTNEVSVPLSSALRRLLNIFYGGDDDDDVQAECISEENNTPDPPPKTAGNAKEIDQEEEDIDEDEKSNIGRILDDLNQDNNKKL